jgi:hypothetical protein
MVNTTLEGKTMRRMLAVVLMGCAAALLAHASVASASVPGGNARTDAAGRDYEATGDWSGVKATMQIASGTCDDYANYGFIGEVLWGAAQSPADPSTYLEIGYRRGWFRM